MKKIRNKCPQQLMKWKHFLKSLLLCVTDNILPSGKVWLLHIIVFSCTIRSMFTQILVCDMIILLGLQHYKRCFFCRALTWQFCVSKHFLVISVKAEQCSHAWCRNKIKFKDCYISFCNIFFTTILIWCCYCFTFHFSSLGITAKASSQFSVKKLQVPN